MSEFNVTSNNSASGVGRSSAAKSSSANNSSSSSSIQVFKKLTKEEFIKKLGITPELYEQILLENPNITQTEIEQLVQKMKAEEAANANGTEKTSSANTASETSQAEKVESHTHEHHHEVHEKNPESFDKAAYNKADLSQKREILTVEIAKNHFLYGDKSNPRTEEEWNNLSPEEKTALVNKVVEFGKAHKTEFAKMLEAFDKNGQTSLADNVMSSIQAANNAGLSLEEYAKLSPEKREELLYDYLVRVNAEDEGTGEPSFSKTEQEFWDRNQLLKEAADYYFKTEKNETRNVCPGEVNQLLNEENIDIETVMKNYLDNKAKTGKLSEYEKAQKEYLDSSSSRELALLAQQENPELSDPPSLYSKINSTGHADKYNNAMIPQKAEILNNLLEKESAGDSKAYYTNMVACAKDAYIKGDKALAHALMQKAMKNAPEFVVAIPEDASATEVALSAGAVSVLSEEDAAAYTANVEKLKSEKLAQAAGVAVRQNVTEPQMVSVSAVRSRFEAVQRANVDMRNRAESVEVQEEVNKNIAKTCDTPARAYAIATTGKLHKDAQLPALKEQLKDKNEALILEASRVPSTLHKTNQFDSLKLVKGIALGMPKDFSKQVELNLANQIPLCKDKDVQLAMHKEIMTSKHSAVQEQAASNIKDYNHSIQSEAIDVVYASGNSQAVKVVLDNLAKMPPDIQKSEVVRLIGELSVSNAIQSENLDAKIFGGTLSSAELRNLSASQRRDYFVKMFEEATPAKKLEILRNIATSSIGIHKKTIYTIIARFSAPLLKSMVEDGMGLSMIRAGVPSDAVTKIITCMKTSTSNKVIQQRKELELDSDFEKYFNGNDSIAEKAATIPPDLKNTFAANPDKTTLEELRRNKATMYIKS